MYIQYEIDDKAETVNMPEKTLHLEKEFILSEFKMDYIMQISKLMSKDNCQKLKFAQIYFYNTDLGNQLQ